MIDGEGEGAPTGPTNAAEAESALDTLIDQGVEELETGSEAGGAPAAEEAAPGEAAPTRDQQGRFTRRAPPSRPAAGEEPAPAETLETPGEPNAEPGAEGAPPAGAEAQEPAFSVRADGVSVEFPGSAVGEDGAFFPIDQLPELQRLVAQGKVHEGSYRQRLSIAADEVRRAAARADGAEKALTDTFTRLEQMMADGTLTEWLANVQQNLPIMKAEAKARAAERQLAVERQQREAATNERETATLGPQMETAIETLLVRYGEQYDLNPEQLEGLYARLNTPRFRGLIFSRAQQDDPRIGVRRGEIVVDQDVVADEVKHYAAALGRRAVSAEERKRIAAADAKNKQTLNGRPGAPPAVSARRGPAPKGGARLPQFKTTEEADDFLFNKGGLEQLAEEAEA